MNNSSFAKANQLFSAALERPESERESFLQKACGDDQALLARVRSMLEQDAKAESEKEGDRLAAAVRGSQQQFRHVQQPIPEQIGPFRLLRKLGEGGMGTIYLAERSGSDFDQRVAIKILRDFDGTAFTSARLRRERRLLANLEHPGVARFIDGGELEDGTPYVVMEYINGVSLTRYANDYKLDLSSRLNLFLQLLDAIGYAHRHLIVHRDIKPDNVLVDGEGKVRLLDFGIAKLLESSEDKAALNATMTIAGAMTPCYASPEQLQGRPISTQTDIYSLGVVLYELLTGYLPFAPEPGLSELQLQNEICSSRAQPPSMLAKTVTPSRRLRGDLDNITLKALRKEPSRRYHSVNAFDEDIRHYLKGRPVSARPDSWSYRAGKFITRNPIGFAVSLLLVTTLLAFALTTQWQAERYAEQRDRAEVEASAARQVAEYMVDLFQVHDPIESSDRDLSAKDMLDKAAASLPDKMRDSPLLRARMMHVIGLSYANTGDYENSTKMLKSALAIREAELGPNSMEVSDSLNRIGNVYRMYGQLDLAEQALTRALNIRKQLSTGPNVELADAFNNVGLLQYQLGLYPQALNTLQESINMHSQINGDQTKAVSTALHNRTLALLKLGLYTQAEAEIRRSIDIKKSQGLQGRSSLYNSQGLLASISFNLGELEESFKLRQVTLENRRKIYSQGHPGLISDLIGMGKLNLMLNQPAKAELMFNEALHWADKIDSSSRLLASKALLAQGQLSLATGDIETASQTLNQSLRIRSAALDANHLDLADAQHWAGVAALANGDLTKARSLLQSAQQQRDAQWPNHHPLRRESKLAIAALDALSWSIDTAAQSLTTLVQEPGELRSLRNDLITMWAIRCLAELPATSVAQTALNPEETNKPVRELLTRYLQPGHPLLSGSPGRCPGIGYVGAVSTTNNVVQK